MWTEKILSQKQKILMKRARGDGESGEGGVAMDNAASVREFLSDISDKKRAEYESQREEASGKKMNSGQQKGNNRSNDGHGERKRANPRDDDDDFDEMPPPKKASVAKGTTTKKARSRRADVDSDSDMEYEAPKKSAASPPRPSRKTTAKKPKYTYDDSDAEEIEDSEDEVMPKSTARGKKVASSSPTRNGRNSRPTIQLDSDSDDEPSTHFRGGGAWGSASQNTNGRGRR